MPRSLAPSAAMIGRASTLALLAGCIPSEPPPWVVSEPAILGFQTAVVEPGPYSDGILLTAGYSRVEPLPLDTIELKWFIVAPAAAGIHEPVWFACPTFGFVNCFTSGAELPACPAPLPLAFAEPCRLGVGSPLRVALGDLLSLVANPRARLSVYAVGGHGDVDSETCLRRLLDPPVADLESCLLGRQEIELGPRWRLLWLAPFLDDVGIAITQALLEEPPNVNPVVSWFVVTREADGRAPVQALALPGATVEVEPGERVTVEPQLPAGVEQDYYEAVKDMDGSWTTQIATESIRTRVMVSVDLPGFEPADGAEVFRWTATDEPVTLYLRVRDTRGGVELAELYVAPRGEGP